MIRSAATVLLLALAAPAAAETLLTPDQAVAELKAASGEALLKAAYATCLSLGGTGNQAGEAFAAAGWDVATDDEAGFSEIAGPEEVFALTWTDGGYCLVQSETVGSARATALLGEVFQTSGLTAVEDQDEEGCLSYQLQDGALRAGVASSGNDPVCASDENSGVSFMWGTAE